MTAAEQGAASPPVRPASMYAAKFRGGPGPGTYESSATIVTPRGSPRGTFGTGPQRATFGKERAPPPGQYSPRSKGRVLGEYSFSKDSRFKGAAGSGDPGAYNPRPRSEGRAPSSYSIRGRHSARQEQTPGPGAHNLARFGDAEQHSYDSFHRLAQNSSRYSFGTLSRPLMRTPGAQHTRRVGRPDAGSPRGGGMGGRSPGTPKSGRREAAAAAAAAAAAPEGEWPMESLKQLHESSPRHPMQSAKDPRRFAPEEPSAHGNAGPMDPAQPSSGSVGPGQYEMPPTLGVATDIRFKQKPSYTILTKKEEKRRFISKEHSDASMMSLGSPGPALYGKHQPLGVGVPAAVPVDAMESGTSVGEAPLNINSGRFVRGLATSKRAPAFGFGTAARDAPGSQLMA